jgi:DNA-binding XRE family transcriptional regulator
MMMPAKVKPSEHPSRGWSNKAKRKKYVASLLHRLDTLEARSHPNGGSNSAKGKDLAAFDALETAGELVRTIAGWAIDHQTGLALEGLSFVPLQPWQTKNHPEYKARREVVDDHKHERNSANLVHEIDDVRVARTLLLNLLRANSGAFPTVLVQLVIEAIEGLELGERSRLFTAVKAWRKAGLRELRQQLRAIAFVAYRRAKGATKEHATEDVAKVFGVSKDTVISWEKRLPIEFGQLEVSRAIAFAKNHASWKNSDADYMYGDDALNTAGKTYQAILRKAKLQASGVRGGALPT